MLIRTTVLSLALAGCAIETGPDPLEDTEDQSVTTCSKRRFPCDPRDGASEWICTLACGDGAAAHCRPYSDVDEFWCILHPDTFDEHGRYCDAWGNPTWDTVCVAGPRP